MKIDINYVSRCIQCSRCRWSKTMASHFCAAAKGPGFALIPEPFFGVLPGCVLEDAHAEHTVIQKPPKKSEIRRTRRTHRNPKTKNLKTSMHTSRNTVRSRRRPRTTVCHSVYYIYSLYPLHTAHTPLYRAAITGKSNKGGDYISELQTIRKKAVFTCAAFLRAVCRSHVKHMINGWREDASNTN